MSGVFAFACSLAFIRVSFARSYTGVMGVNGISLFSIFFLETMSLKCSFLSQFPSVAQCVI